MYTLRFPSEVLEEFPVASAYEMQRIFNAMLKISPCTLYEMMEKAGAAIARVAGMYTSAIFPEITILAGKGHNGGAALVAAKNMAAEGASIHILLAQIVSALKPAVLEQLEMLQQMFPERIRIQNPPVDYSTLDQCDLIIDGLVGYNFDGSPTEQMSRLITLANEAPVPTISVDLPSGLHPDTGQPAVPTIHACSTVVLSIPKKGMLQSGTRKYLGDLYLAYSGISSDIINQVITPRFFPKTVPEILHLR